MTCNVKKEYWESEYFHLQDPIVCYIYIYLDIEEGGGGGGGGGIYN